MLTNTSVKNAKPSQKIRRIWDTRGLYLEVAPSGGKWWRLKYRFGGKERRLSLGTFPDVSLAKARKRRDAARELVADGVDPSARRKKEKAEQRAAAAQAAKEQTRRGDTFGAIARQWQRRQKVAAGTARKNAQLLDTYLLPAFRDVPITEIDAPRLLAVLRKIEATGRLETARRVKMKFGQVCRFAIIEGRLETDPTVVLRGALESPDVRHHPAVTEPAKVGALMRAIWAYEGHPVTASACKIAALCFPRPGELRKAEWHEIDTAAALWRIPGERMKMKTPHLIPLSAQALEVLEELRQLTGPTGYVFPSIRSASRPMSENTVNAALRRLGYGRDEMTGHGFRSMASKNLNEMGYRAVVVERQLAHMERNESRAAYVSAAEYLQERTAMMQAWADTLDRLRTGADVVPLHRRA